MADILIFGLFQQNFRMSQTYWYLLSIYFFPELCCMFQHSQKHDKTTELDKSLQILCHVKEKFRFI